MKMDIKAGKLNIIQQLLQVDDELLLEAIQQLLDYGAKQKGEALNKDFWDELTTAQKKQIDLSRQQHRAGKGILHDQVMTEFRNKYSA